MQLLTEDVPGSRAFTAAEITCLPMPPPVDVCTEAAAPPVLHGSQSCPGGDVMPEPKQSADVDQSARRPTESDGATRSSNTAKKTRRARRHGMVSCQVSNLPKLASLSLAFH